MARYLLDTDVLIDYSKRREPAVSRIHQMIDDGDELGVCAVNLAEFFAGIAPPDRPYWHQVFTTLVYWDISAAAAERAGQFRYDYARQGQALAITDCLLAAVSLEHGAVLVTNNARHYPIAGLQLLSLR